MELPRGLPLRRNLGLMRYGGNAIRLLNVRSVEGHGQLLPKLVEQAKIRLDSRAISGR